MGASLCKSEPIHEPVYRSLYLSLYKSLSIRAFPYKAAIINEPAACSIQLHCVLIAAPFLHPQ